jgi:hypothetical protein
MTGIELQTEFTTVIRDAKGRITSKEIGIYKMDGTPKSVETTKFDENGQTTEHVVKKFDEHGKLTEE